MRVKNQLATISIIINGREKLADKVQKILTEYSHIVIARMGVNIQPKCIKDCTGVIVLIAKGEMKEIKKLTEKLNKISGVTAKQIVLGSE
jgi:putative iron-only hydrogenase system regulator